MNKFFKRLAISILLVATSAASANAAPAISNGSFAAGTSGWDYFAGGSTVSSDSSGLISSSTTAGLILGTNASTAEVATIWSAVGRTLPGGAITPANFMTAFSNTAAISGAYQAFSLANPNGSISLSLEYFASADAGSDPFVFLYNQDSGTYAVLRGNGTGSFNSTNYSTNTLAGATVSAPGGLRVANGATGGTTPSGAPLSFGERTVSFANLVAGNYVIGFGVGVGETTAGTFGIAVTNILSPDNPSAVPEIDTASAGLPVAIVLMAFCLVADRRRRVAPSEALV